MAMAKPKVAPLSQEDMAKLHANKEQKFKRLRKLTTPLYSMAHLEKLVVRADSEPFEADFNVALPGKPESKPTVMKVTNMEDGEEALLILNTIMLTSLKRAGGDIVGRFFQFNSGGIREGKQYRDVEVEELVSEE